MKTRILILLSVCLSVSTLEAVNIAVDTSQERAAISPYIYGSNQDLPGVTFTARRSGGNRLTGYNWENNASNAGTDWYNNSDSFMTFGLPDSQQNVPGIAITNFHDESIAMGAYSLVTLQMAGYAAKDKNGVVYSTETAPSPRWAEVNFVKGSAFSITPSTGDNYVYMDEFVNFLVNRYGSASAATGVKGYLLDNEPDLWNSTHPRIHPSTTTCAEYLAKSAALSTAVKTVDPYAEIYGPVSYGFDGYLTFQNAPDWNSVKGGYSWFLDYYLDGMKQASDTAGKRLLDTLDVHWYSEATGGGSRITGVTFDPLNIDCNKARVQAPRTLWDPAYKTAVQGSITAGENSWINQWDPQFLPLIPKMRSSVNTYYPGTKISFTEYNYGGESHISGGIAMADVLGIFGKYGVYLAAYWQVDSGTKYAEAAFNLYRNFDGNNGAYGGTKVKAETDDVTDMPVYASVSGNGDSQLHLILINRNYDNPLTANIILTSTRAYTSGRVWAFDSAASTITERAAISNISGNSFSYPLDKLSACHIVLYATDTSTPPPVTQNPPPAVTTAAGVYPNPCNLNNGYLTFSNLAGRANLKIYTLTGKLVREIEQDVPSGKLDWDLKNKSGQPAAAGVYLYRIKTTDGTSLSGKLAITN